MFILLVFNDLEKQDINFIGKFKLMKNLIDYTGGLVRYSDKTEKKRCYRTYKALFSVIKIDKFTKRRYQLY